MNHAQTLAALRRVILEEPDDDLPRYALADALQDSDDAAERTEGAFVAASMRLATCGIRDCESKLEEANCLECRWCRPWRETIAAWRKFSGQGYLAYGPGYPLWESDARVFPQTTLAFWRGLPVVWAVADVPTFVREALYVFSRYPIRRVVLRCEVEAIIWDATRCSGGMRRRHDVSRAVYEMLRGPKVGNWCGYASPELARADLEACLVTHGRKLAKLPPLPEDRR